MNIIIISNKAQTLSGKIDFAVILRLGLTDFKELGFAENEMSDFYFLRLQHLNKFKDIIAQHEEIEYIIKNYAITKDPPEITKDSLYQ